MGEVTLYDPSSGEPDAGYYHGIKGLGGVIGEVKSTTCDPRTIISELIQKSEDCPGVTRHPIPYYVTF